MKCRITILALICTLQIISTDSFQECPKNNYIIVDNNGNKIDCLPCQSCNFGYGLTPPCGSELTEAQKKNIKCPLCEPGKTYSDEHGPSSCKSCQICPVPMKNCTAESNTQCSRNCKKGYYYDNSTYNCQLCSHCCRKDNKRIAECAGLPAGQCSVHDALECSPKTTMNPPPTSTNDGSNGDHHKQITAIIIAVIVVVAAIVIGVAIFILVWCLKYKKKRNDAGPQEKVTFRKNNCGITQDSSFSIMVNPPLAPGCRAQEGKVLSLICKNQGSDQDDNYFDNDCNYTYDWEKDMMNYPFYTREIYLNPVHVKDFGKYTCQVKCKQHPNQDPVEAVELDLDVVPGPAKRYKTFAEINSLEVYDKIADLLKSPPTDIGGWERVAEKYSMESSKRQAIKGDEDRGMQVIEYLKASQPKLTVYEFCKYMKIIKQNRIVELLENHLTCKKEEQEQGRRQDIERDSGYGYDLNYAQNNPGLNDSRRGSRDELPANSHYGKEKRNDEKRKFDRQISNQSAKSSGSAGSGSTSSSLKTAVNFVRQISQNSAYKKHENEDGDLP